MEMKYRNKKGVMYIMQTTGIDIVNNNRIKEIIEKNQNSFYNRIFTENELQYIQGKNHDYKTIAGLFSAKESISKAIGTGIGKISFKDIDINHDYNGKPFVRFNKENPYFKSINSIEISISHEKDYAISIAIVNWNNQQKIWIPEEIKGTLKKRKKDTHKGSYGKVGIIAGSKGMTGANYLTSMAALRTGSGLVYSFVPEDLVNIMSNKFIEVIVKEIPENNNILKQVKELDALALGPGLGISKNKIEMVRELILCYDNPIVLDADGINALANDPEVLKERKQITIITPHPGELAKLLNKSLNEIQENRLYYAKYTSNKYKVITLLKGHSTIVTDGDLVYINSTGNPGMATAGSGDVLTGIIVSLICQNINGLDSAILGTFIHGLAGDLASLSKGEYGLIASDILEYIPKAMKALLEVSY